MRKVIANTSDIVKPVKNIGFKALLIAITLLISSASSVPTDFKVDVVVIDAGHGGHDSGTLGSSSKEKDVVLKIALKLGAHIKENIQGVKVIYTRETDKFIDLSERANIANRNHADVFISIHANSLPTKTPDARKQSIYGTETYVMGLHKTDENFEVSKRENSVILLEENYKEKYEGFDPDSPESYILFSLTQSANQESSLLLASKVEDQFGQRAGRKSRGVKQAGFVVLYKTSMPSILIETGFLSNTKEERELNSDKVQDYIASGIYRAFKEYKNQIESVN
ncbi:MAG: N-acetylmuramoyl-L-alanine amidase [Cyclobacteriaceae bacterium]